MARNVHKFREITRKNLWINTTKIEYVYTNPISSKSTDIQCRAAGLRVEIALLVCQEPNHQMKERQLSSILAPRLCIWLGNEWNFTFNSCS